MYLFFKEVTNHLAVLAVVGLIGIGAYEASIFLRESYGQRCPHCGIPTVRYAHQGFSRCEICEKSFVDSPTHPTLVSKH